MHQVHVAFPVKTYQKVTFQRIILETLPLRTTTYPTMIIWTMTFQGITFFKRWPCQEPTTVVIWTMTLQRINLRRATFQTDIWQTLTSWGTQ
ncbi:uncharacterized protein LOC115317245 [Ixodes scapularis]|uniref:uncharacterized protein LOC115317245 n=1 Tax=Ixodes scapularis TaxID=6945 RepID=UPI001A9EFD1D|nr:uncharacterized protein LOC115317245 [Ixodes scapularis]